MCTDSGHIKVYRQNNNLNVYLYVNNIIVLCNRIIIVFKNPQISNGVY